MALSKEAAYSLAERNYKQCESEKAAANFRRWIGRDRVNEEDNNDAGNGTGRARVIASRSKKQKEGT